MKNGADSIQVFSDLDLLKEPAKRWDDDKRLMLAERGGKKINGYDQELKSNGEDIDYSVRVRDEGLSTFYCHDAICFHLQNDDVKSLSARVWRYHSYGYKIKKIFYNYFKFLSWLEDFVSSNQFNKLGSSSKGLGQGPSKSLMQVRILLGLF